MAHRIFKQALDVLAGPAWHEIPRGARMLSVGQQEDSPVVWFLCDDRAPIVKRQFIIKGTGHEVEPAVLAFDFLGTVSTFNGTLMWHVFVEPERI